jgi:hypothetical protein
MHHPSNRSPLASTLGFALALALPAVASAADYDVGPGQTFATIGEVPWDGLQPGDNVLIHWQADPYHEKWVICARGTEAQPITVRGVAGPNGELPVIDGQNAVTPSNLDYTNEERGVIKIGSANVPSDVLPAYIVLEGLDVRSGRPPYSFTAADGSTLAYADNAAAIYVEKAEHLTIRRCAIHDSGNGLFIGVFDGATQDVLVEANHVYDNGNEGSIYEHNSYTAALGITFQYNHYGPLRTGCGGNNLKDRSAGQVVRYNWIEAGNRQLDLVDGEDSPNVVGDPRYNTTFVYGNVLVEHEDEGNSQILHYGGDSGDESIYRKGTLYFYNNTVVSLRAGNTTLMRLSSNEEHADCRNNVVYVTADGSALAMTGGTGVLSLSHNWFKPGSVATHDTLEGTIDDDGTSVTGTSPGFADEANADYHLADGSACINAGTALDPAVLPTNDLVAQYVSHQAGEGRPIDPPLDVGAFERCTSGNCVVPDAGTGGAAQGGSGPGGSGTGGNGTGANGSGATTGASSDAEDEGGCGCRATPRSSHDQAWIVVSLLGLAVAGQRRIARRLGSPAAPMRRSRELHAR